METQAHTPLDIDLQQRLSFRSSVTDRTQPETDQIPTQNGNNHVSTFLKKWTTWRTNLNRSLILKSEITRQLYARPHQGLKRLSTKRSFRKIVRGPDVEIDQELSDFIFQRALDDRYEGGRRNLFMTPETFLTFGIPRPRRNSPSTTPQPSDIEGPPSPDSSISDTEPTIIHGFILKPNVKLLHEVNRTERDLIDRVNSRQIKQIEPFPDYDNNWTRF